MSRRDWISYQPIPSRTSPIIRSWIPYGWRTTNRTSRLIGLGRVSLTSQRENSITRSWMPYGLRTTSWTILDLDGLLVGLEMEGSKVEVVILILFI